MQSVVLNARAAKKKIRTRLTGLAEDAPRATDRPIADPAVRERLKAMGYLQRSQEVLRTHAKEGPPPVVALRLGFSIPEKPGRVRSDQRPAVRAHLAEDVTLSMYKPLLRPLTIQPLFVTFGPDW